MFHLLTFIFTWTVVSIIFVIALLLDAAPAMTLDLRSLALAFSVVGVPAVVYLLLLGAPSIWILTKRNQLNLGGFVLCGLICSLPMVVIGVIDGDPIWMIAPLAAGLAAAFVCVWRFRAHGHPGTSGPSTSPRVRR